MRSTSIVFVSLAIALVAACGSETELPTARVDAVPAVEAPSASAFLTEQGVNAGTYELEKTHASLIWTVSHNGLSKYTTRFTDFDAAIEFNVDDPTASSVTASINPLSVRTDHPSGPDWDMTLASDAKWFNAAAFPTITFKSTNITLLGETSGTIEGELTLLGVTQPIAMDTMFNGVRNFPWYGERDVIGFSATTELKRSDFGMLALLPDIGDVVSISLEVEFVQAE